MAGNNFDLGGNQVRRFDDLRAVNNNPRTSLPKYLLAPVAAAALTLSLAACGSDDDSSSDTVAETMTSEMGEMAGSEVTVGDITVADAWIREPAEGQTKSAVYATITNDGDADVTFVSASLPIDGTVEIHETVMGDDGTMAMQERPDGFVIAAGESFTLEPGGPHIMLIDIDPAQIIGTIDVTLVFDDGTEVTIAAEVRTVDGMTDMEDDMTGTTMAG